MPPVHPWQSSASICHTQLLLSSFRRWTARDLVPSEGSELEMSRRLFEAPLVVLSHDTAPDPLLTYGNRMALDLFELDWESLRRIPSRLTAEEPNRAERAAQLERAARDGFIENYSGVRVSRGGRRFRIEGAWIWTIVDGNGDRVGQGAAFREWIPVDG